MMLVKLFWVLCALLFTAAAALQLNDPDPLYWFCAYAGVALACVQFAMRRGPQALVWLVTGFCLAGAAVTASGFLGWLDGGASLLSGMGEPNVELAREFLGAVIALMLLGAGLVLTRERP
jgi:hypothetical protein